MLLIVLCHIIAYLTFIPGHTFLSQVFNVGVFSFLAISGFLYGGKTVTDWPGWFRKRCGTVLLPALCITVIVLGIGLCSGNHPDGFSTVIYLLNLQGLAFVFPGLYRWFCEVQVLGPLWFITVIILCYCMTPALQAFRNKIRGIRYGYLSAAGAMGIVFAVLILSGINTVYFLTFAFGYCMAARDCLKQAGWKQASLLTGGMLTAQISRLLLRAACDGTPFYQGYTQISQMILGLWILLVFLWIGKCLPKLLGKLAAWKPVVVMDKISFYIYLTHCCFCKGPWNIYEHTDNILLATVGFAGATLLAATVLRTIAAKLQHCLDR